MMKRYKIGNKCYWYEEGSQPDSAVECKLAKKAKTSTNIAEVAAKAKIPLNKAKGVKAK